MTLGTRQAPARPGRSRSAGRGPGPRARRRGRGRRPGRVHGRPRPGRRRGGDQRHRPRLPRRARLGRRHRRARRRPASSSPSRTLPRRSTRRSVPEPDLTVHPSTAGRAAWASTSSRLAMDELTHAPRPGGGNILTMARRLDPTSEGGPIDGPGDHDRAGRGGRPPSRSSRSTASSTRPTSRASSTRSAGCTTAGRGTCSSTSPTCGSWPAPAWSRCTRSCGSCTASRRPIPRPAGRALARRCRRRTPDRGPAVRPAAGGRARPVADGAGPAVHRPRRSGRGPRRVLTPSPGARDDRSRSRSRSSRPSAGCGPPWSSSSRTRPATALAGTSSAAPPPDALDPRDRRRGRSPAAGSVAWGEDAASDVGRAVARVAGRRPWRGSRSHDRPRRPRVMPPTPIGSTRSWPTAVDSSAASCRSSRRRCPGSTSPATTRRPARSAATSSTCSGCAGGAGR